MSVLVLLLLLVWPSPGGAQTRDVRPSDLSLTVTVEENLHTPVTREMILITIKGIYRRRITRETLVQPDFDGFSWSQLGSDLWREERIDGRTVKTFTRRMAIYPDRPGRLTIGAFTHHLTLTDESDDWFEHEVRSEPVEIEVDSAPVSADWWFPVRQLRVSDEWSNAPDQLQPGEGVLRVVRVEALGVTTEMLPPMPELTSPSAMIFPHPEKRFAELTPEGPVSYAFWRWTIRPTNDTSAIVEPMRFSYFDTTLREPRDVTISAQRVAYGDAPPEPVSEILSAAARRGTPDWLLALVAATVFGAGIVSAVAGRRFDAVTAFRRLPLLDPLARRLYRAARAGDVGVTRRTARSILRRDGETERRRELLRDFDRQVFAASRKTPALPDFARAFIRA